jgi:hypothetical protein
LTSLVGAACFYKSKNKELVFVLSAAKEWNSMSERRISTAPLVTNSDPLEKCKLGFFLGVLHAEDNKRE